MKLEQAQSKERGREIVRCLRLNIDDTETYLSNNESSVLFY